MKINEQMKQTMIRIEELFAEAGERQVKILEELTKVANVMDFIGEVYKKGN